MLIIFYSFKTGNILCHMKELINKKNDSFQFLLFQYYYCYVIILLRISTQIVKLL